MGEAVFTVKTPVTACRPRVDFGKVRQRSVLPVRTGPHAPGSTGGASIRLCRLWRALLHTSRTDIPRERGVKSPLAQIFRLSAQIKNQNVPEASPGSL